MTPDQFDALTLEQQRVAINKLRAIVALLLANNGGSAGDPATVTLEVIATDNIIGRIGKLPARRQARL
jgi:hypothetical protein